MSRRTLNRPVVRAAILDVVAVLVFVAIGRRSHDEGGSVIGGVLAVAAPFLIGLVVAWLVARTWLAPVSVERALVEWPVLVVAGMLLRRFVFDRSTALAFVIVTAVVTGLLLIGWRAILGVVAARRSAARS